MVEFKISGWRAIIGDQFTRRNLERIALALCRELEPGRELLIGYDSRFLSREAALWLTAVLNQHGVKVCLINGQSPTPVVMFGVRLLGLGGGIMVTASHNPAIYNGLKLFVEQGHYADLDFLTRLNQRLASLPATEPAGEDALVEYRPVNISNAYVRSLFEQVDSNAIAARGLKVVADVMHGAAGALLARVLYQCGCDVHLLHQQHDTLFGRRSPAPEESLLYELGAEVRHRDFSVGIAIDGDGDRLGLVDEQGRYINSDQMLLLLSHHLFAERGWRGPLVRNLATTHALDRLAADYGQKLYETPVGFKHVINAMEKHQAILAGESSGGLTVRGHLPGKDGLLAALLLLELLSKLKIPLSLHLSQLRHRYGFYHSLQRSIKVPAHRRELIGAKLLHQEELPAWLCQDLERTNTGDGLKLYYQQHWWLFRFSNTEPLLRLQAEGPDLAVLQQQSVAIEDWLEPFLA